MLWERARPTGCHSVWYIRLIMSGSHRKEIQKMRNVEDLPMFPIAMAKLNENQLKVLKIISESIYKIEGGSAALSWE